MKVLELFSGTESFSKVAESMGHDTFTVDNDARFNSDLCKDIMDLDISEIPFKPDVIWASPPCQKFSIMVVSKNWIKENGNYIPKNQGVIHAIGLVKKTLDLTRELNPKFFFIENPRAMLRKMDFMQSLLRKTVTYCQYGMPYQKATDIWTNCNSWIPKPICSPKSPCYVRAPRGSRYGIQGMGGFRENREQKHPQDSSKSKSHHAYMHPEQISDDKPLKIMGERLHPNDLGADYNWDVSAKIRRGIVPRELCSEIISVCEKEII